MKLIFKSIYTKKETSTKCKQPENCKNQIRSLKMKFCFLKKEIKTKNPAILYSYLNSIIYTKPFCRKREKKPDSDRSNRTNKIEKESVVHDTGTQKPKYGTCPYFSGPYFHAF